MVNPTTIIIKMKLSQPTSFTGITGPFEHFNMRNHFKMMMRGHLKQQNY